MTASARHAATQPRQRRRRARHPAAQPGPERRRRGCAMTASARHPAQGIRAQCPGRWSRKAERVEPCHGYSGAQGGQPGVGSRDESWEGGIGRREAASSSQQPAGQCRLQGMEAGRHELLRGVPTEAGPAPSAAGPRCRREGEQRGCMGWCRGPTSNRPRCPRADSKGEDESRWRITGDAAHIVSSARRAIHRCKESRRWKESRHYQNRCRYRTPAHAQACSRHRFHGINLLSPDRGGGLYLPLSSRAGPAY